MPIPSVNVTEVIQRPLKLIDASFDAAVGDAKNIGNLPKSWNEKEDIAGILGLNTTEGFYAVPSINDVPLVEMYAPESLVRFRCMTQDVFDPEYYAGAVRVIDTQTGGSKWLSTKYRDSIHSLASFPEEQAAPGRLKIDEDCLYDPRCLAARVPVYCVPPPGEMRWAREKASMRSLSRVSGANGNEEGQRAKRGREDDDVTMEGEVPSSCPAPCCSKRANKEGDGNGMPDAEGEEGTSEAKSGEVGLNFPLPWEAEKVKTGEAPTGCLLKFYDMNDTDTLKINECIEVVGILGAKSTAAAGEDPDKMHAEDDLLRSPVPALVPVVHVIAYRSLGYWSPLIERPLTRSETAAESVPPSFDVQWQSMLAKGPYNTAQDLHEAMISYLAAPLGGDLLAAEYLLLCLASSDLHTMGEDRAIGKFTLNLSGFHSDAPPKPKKKGNSWGAGPPPFGSATKGVLGAVQELMPLCAGLPLYLDLLRKMRFAPKKDLDLNRLLTGALQLAKGTAVLIDETVLSEGSIKDLAVENLRALTSLLASGTVMYDFDAYPLAFKAPVSSVVLSQGTAILKPTDIQIKIKPIGAAAPSMAQVDAATMDQLRSYIALVSAKTDIVGVTDAVGDVVANKFAALRQDNKGVSSEHLHRWMGMARTASFLKGEASLSVETWEAILALEREREGRNSPPTQPAPAM